MKEPMGSWKRECRVVPPALSAAMPRRGDDAALVGMLSDVVKEGSLPRACLAGEEDIASCVGDEVLDVLLALHG